MHEALICRRNGKQRRIISESSLLKLSDVGLHCLPEPICLKTADHKGSRNTNAHKPQCLAHDFRLHDVQNQKALCMTKLLKRTYSRSKSHNIFIFRLQKGYLARCFYPSKHNVFYNILAFGIIISVHHVSFL